MDDGFEKFRDFLEAKLPVDDRSINKEIFSNFLQRIHANPAPAILDIGTGTGSMLRRIIKGGIPPGTELVGLDPDLRLLHTAQREITRLLAREGFRVSQSAFRIDGEGPGGKLSVELLAGDILDSSSLTKLGRRKFSAVTANALMDILPVDEALLAVSELLAAPSGLLYATINYDGLTRFLPLYADREFENRLLEAYDCSMDARLVSGKKTGGSRGGSVLFTAAARLGFEILGYGSSDWCVHPRNGTYAETEERFLSGLLAIFYEEERRQPEIDANQLEAWYEERCVQLKNRSLSLVVHQTDLLARRPGSPLTSLQSARVSRQPA